MTVPTIATDARTASSAAAPVAVPAAAWTVVDSPVDPLLLTTDGQAVTALHFTPFVPPEVPRDDGHPVLAAAAGQLREYFAGQRTDFDLPLAARGTAFQRDVWRALRSVPYGRTASYADIAVAIGRDPRTTSRAVGQANRRNPIAIVVPCHRVIGVAGALVGYAGGMSRKQRLLDLEAARLP